MSKLFSLGGQYIGASALALLSEYSGLITFRTDCFDLLAAQGTLSPTITTHLFSSTQLLYGPTLTSIHD